MSLTTVTRLAVAHRHAGGLLAAVLQGVEAEVGQVGDGLAGGVHAEDAAGLLRGVVVGRRGSQVEPGGLVASDDAPSIEGRITGRLAHGAIVPARRHGP